MYKTLGLKKIIIVLILTVYIYKYIYTQVLWTKPNNVLIYRLSTKSVLFRTFLNVWVQLNMKNIILN